MGQLINISTTTPCIIDPPKKKKKKKSLYKLFSRSHTHIYIYIILARLKFSEGAVVIIYLTNNVQATYVIRRPAGEEITQKLSEAS